MLKWAGRLGVAAVVFSVSVNAEARVRHIHPLHAAVVGHDAVAHEAAAAKDAQTATVRRDFGDATAAHPAAMDHQGAIEAYLQPIHAAPVGAVTRVPYGWADFCGRRPVECRVDVLSPVDVVMSDAVMDTLEAVNARVNAEIEPVSNLDHWGTLLDHWDYPVDGKGDCKIYALWKRKQLLDMGFPRQALLMTIVRGLEGNGHTILTVKTDRGDYILDNMVGEIRLWDETGYTFVKRQAQTDPNVWVSVGPAAMPVTTAGLN